MSTGNDIVALNAIDKQRSNQPLFYSKIISASEKELYDAQAPGIMPFENYLWLLWSIKESAFKYQQRLNNSLLFSPAKLVVQQLNFPEKNEAFFDGLEWHNTLTADSFCEGVITTASGNLYFRSNMYQQLVATVVHDNANFNQVYWGVKRISDSSYAHQSQAVRSFALGKLNSLIPGQQFQIQKNTAGCPLIINNKSHLSLPISLAHHGHYISYSFLLNG